MYSSHNLISVKEAFKRIEKYLKPVEDDETILLTEAYGRISSEDVYSRMDNPPFDRSEVDGFAVRISDLSSETPDGNRLKIGGKVIIGTDPSKSYEKAVCIQISTGSVVPKGFDAVYRVEDVKVKGDSIIFPGRPQKFGNIAKAGSDVLSGDLVLKKFKMITEKEIGSLTILGIERVRVFRKLRVGVLSSGNELVTPGSELKPGQSYEGNSTFIMAKLAPYNVFLPTSYGIVPDNQEETVKVLERAFSENDVVITTGGSSAGEMDYIGKIAAGYSPGIIFHGIDMKPGKPTFFALNGDKFMIGLPGFPVSAFISFTQIFLEKLLEITHFPNLYQALTAQLALGTTIKKGSTNFIPAILYGSDRLYAFPLTGESGSLSRILRSDAIITVDSDKDYLEAGEDVTVQSLNEEPNLSSGVLVGHVDPIMDTIFSISSDYYSWYRTSFEEGLMCLETGSANLMGMRMKYESKPRLPNRQGYKFYRIFSVDVGIVFGKGESNFYDESDSKKGIVFGVPANGTYPDDIIESCVTYLNPDAGSRISRVEYFDLRGIALAVRNGRIPAGIGNADTASRYKLDFTPVLKEAYYIAVSKENLKEFDEILKKIGNAGLMVLKENYRSYQFNDALFLK